MSSLREAVKEAGGDFTKLVQEKLAAEDDKIARRQDLEREVSEGTAVALTIIDGLSSTRQ